MCGFYFSRTDLSHDFSEDDIHHTLDKIKHRGPDASGVTTFRKEDKLIALGHRRLSIIDLNERSNQPFHSERYVLSYNGEIYNHLELRKKHLKEVSFRTTSDTETLICLIERIGLEKSLEELNGMFSFVIYDKLKNILHAARDRAGEKPLYLTSSEGLLALSSDMVTFDDHKSFDNTICQNALMEYLNFGYVPAPKTIYQNSFKIPQSHYLSISLNQFMPQKFSSFEDFCDSNGVVIKRYWNLAHAAKQKKELSLEDATHLLENKLEEAIALQQISDVPLGCFLSGGIDSSLITSLMSKVNKSTKTFSIGFEFNEFDESKYAEEIARHLGTQHKTVICSTEETQEIIKSLNSAYTEPFADSSQIPTMMISKIAREDVTVVLTGDCGDELFGGYNRYILASKYLENFYLLPYPIRRLFVYLAKAVGKKPFEFVFSTLFSKSMSGNAGQRANKAFEKIGAIANEFDYYRSMVTEWQDKDKILVESHPDYDFKDMYENAPLEGFIEKMMYLDFNTYMVDDILCKVDRASMFNSLETRVPFLDKHVIELAFMLPEKFKINKGNSKIILNKILEKYVPRDLIERPKQGFGIPISLWMRTDLKKWVQEILSEEINSLHGFFNQKTVNRYLDEHLEGKFNHEHKLWSLIQFNSWYVEKFQ